MREILFRGKRTGRWNKGEWAEGYLKVYEGNAFVNINLDNPYGIQWAEVDSETVGQFTEMTDKNGKRIFEGDIVKEGDIVHNGEIQIHGHIFSVVMRKGCWCVIPAHDTDEWDFLISYCPFLEVIGNIHDNPELLEVTE